MCRAFSRFRGRYLKNSVSKTIVYLIKHGKCQIYRAYVLQELFGKTDN